MKKIDWKRKLSSRKFWACLAALVVSILTAFGVPNLTTEQIAVIISGIGALAVYMLAEGSVDKASAEADIVIDANELLEDEENTDTEE